MIRAGGMEVALLRRTGQARGGEGATRDTGSRWTRRAPSCATRRSFSAPRTRRCGRTSPRTRSGCSSWPSTTWRSACGTTPTRSSRAAIPSAGVVAEPGMALPQDYPLVAYYRGYCAEKAGRSGREDFALASRQSTRYVFPNRPESLVVLRRAVEANPQDATAHFLLGSLLLSGGQSDAALGRVGEGARARPEAPRPPPQHRLHAPLRARRGRRTPCASSRRGWARTRRTSSSTRAPTRR